MGKYLDQCASDAWDIINGRKRIVGNEILECKDNEEKRKCNQDYGWLATDGKFYPVNFGEHQAWASKYLLDRYKNGKIDLKVSGDPGDILCEMGFILLHNPHKYNFLVTRDTTKRITNKQREFLIEYFENKNMYDWLNKIYQDEI